MPTLLIDGTALSAQPKGVGKYTHHVLQAACDQLPPDWSIVLLTSTDLAALYSFDERVRRVEVGWASDLLRGMVLVPALCRRFAPSAVLVPMDVPVWAPGVPYAVITHDIPQLIEAAEAGTASRYRRIVNSVKDQARVGALRRAAHIFCNSAFIQSETIRRYGISAPKTSVAYCGVDARFYAPPLQSASHYWGEISDWSGYVLTFATGDTRESYRLVAAAWASARPALGDVGLVVGGIRPGAGYVKELRENLRQNGLQEGADVLLVPFLGVGDFDRLSALYHGADFYLELSGHEGFGMQLAEALACGTTCISSGRGALREVGGGFPLELSTLDAPSVATALTDGYAGRLHLRDNAAQVRMTRRYNWNKSSRMILDKILAMAR